MRQGIAKAAVDEALMENSVLVVLLDFLVLEI
jgi:hypothetical protein